MIEPYLARSAGGEADALVHQLLVPRLAHTEGIHRSNFHVGNHLRWRNNDGGDFPVGVDAACGQPVAQPEIVCPSGEGHRNLDLFTGRLLGLESGFQSRGIGRDF